MRSAVCCLVPWLLLLATTATDAEGQFPWVPGGLAVGDEGDSTLIAAYATTRRATSDAKPGPPVFPGAVPDADSAIYVFWQEPADTGDSSISGYVVEVSTNAGTNWTDLAFTVNTKYKTPGTRTRHHPALPDVGVQCRRTRPAIESRLHNNRRNPCEETRTPDQPRGDSARDERDPSDMGGAGGHRVQRDHRLPDRSVERPRRELV